MPVHPGDPAATTTTRPAGPLTIPPNCADRADCPAL
jgi:hypothetical protein